MSAPDAADPSFLHNKLQQIAAEMAMLAVGSDEGLIPLFALSSELLDMEDLPERWARAMEHLQALADEYLDDGRAIDEAGIQRFYAFNEWLSVAGAQENAGEELPPLPNVEDGEQPTTGTPGAEAIPGSAPEVEDPADEDEEILSVDLGDDTSLLQEFFQESMEHLDSIEGYLLTLESHPKDKEGLAAVFRAFHSVKGVAGFLQLQPIQRLAHQVESLLDLARNEEILLNSRLFTLILQSCDLLKEMTNAVGVALETGKHVDRRYPIMKLIARIEQTTLETQAGNTPESAVPEAFASDGATMEDESAAPAARVQAKAQTIRVATERINNLMDVVGELVILEAQLTQSAKDYMAGNTIVQRQISQLQRILKDLQHTSMALQMVPIRPTFQRVERIVRDLSQKFSKKIELNIEGEDTELDRTVVELVTDPLVHMIRNAVDHGLETPAEREAVGKDPVGQIDLKAYHMGSTIVIELNDNGRGIDPEKIKAKAHEKGIIPKDAQLTKEEALQLIFAPGFSTAQVLTENSGRGVGMDVVKRNIESMRGAVTVTSEVGKGSSFKIKLPLTTAIIDGLIVRVGKDKFILPTHTVQVTMRPERKQLTKIVGQREMVIMRDRTIPLVRLNRFLGVEDGENDPTNAALAVVESFGKQYALMVDEMINKQEVVIKSLGDVLGKLPGIAGGAILGDGSIALILDPAALARQEVA